MSLLTDIIQMKQFERENELKDINAISSSVENFVKLKQKNIARERQLSIDELSRRNIESQIEARKPSPLDELINKGKAFDAAATIADQTGDTTILDSLRMGSGDPKDFLSPDVAKITPSVDLITQQEPLAPEIGQGLERTPSGKLSEVGKVQLGLQKTAATSKITGEAAVDLQELKKGAEIRRNLSSGDLKLDITLNEFFKFAKEQQDLLGLPAGPLAGALTKVISAMSAENKNKFLAAFEGSRIELAAFVGRNAMPGTRAARIIDLFRKTTPSPFDTIGSGIRNAAVSWGQTIATDFGVNANEYIPGYSDMTVSEQSDARRDILKPYVAEHINLFEDTYTIEAYKVSPEMFTEKDRAKAEKLVRESVRLNLRGK